MARVLSIEIGESLTHVVEMDYRAKTTKIYSCSDFETPEGMLDDGIVRKNENFRTLLSQYCKKNGIKTKKVVFSITSSRIANRSVQIPLVKENKINDIINANASDYFPVDMSEYHIVHQILEKYDNGTEKYYRLSLTAVPDEVTASYFELAKFCDLTIQALDYIGNSIFQVIKPLFAEYRAGTHVIIKMDEKSSLITIVRNSVVGLQRTINYGIDEAVLKLMELEAFGKGLPYAFAFETMSKENCINETLEKTAVSLDKDDDKAKARDEITASLSYLINNIVRIIEYYISRHPDITFDSFHLAGNGAEVKGLDILLSNELNQTVRVLNRITNLKLDKKAQNMKICRYVASIGAGMQPLNLIGASSTSAVKKKAEAADDDIIEKKSVPMIVPVAVCLACIVGSAAYLGFGALQTMQLKDQKSSLRSEVDSLYSIVGVVADYNQVKADYDSIKSLYDLTENPNEGLGEFLIELEEKLPSNIVLTAFSATETDVSLAMEAKTKSDAAMALEQLRTFKSISGLTFSGVTEQEDENTGEVTVTFSIVASYKTMDMLNAEAEAVQNGENLEPAEENSDASQDAQ